MSKLAGATTVKAGFEIAEGFDAALAAAGLTSFEAVMRVETSPSAVMRAVPGRTTVRLETPRGTFYLKRYVGRCPAAAARHEWSMLDAAARVGIAVPRAVALGERRALFTVRESFLLTEEIVGGVQADWWITRQGGDRARLLEPIAGLARRFHDAGFHHQDFYLCHFFVAEKGPALSLSLIDFQRCGFHRGRRRWIVKDLAQLHRSMVTTGFSEGEWEALLRAYGGLDPATARAVQQKSRRIAQHVPKHG